ncbi:MAG: DUF2934 domain-containing protein [Geminicoccaceae bacterium]
MLEKNEAEAGAALPGHGKAKASRTTPARSAAGKAAASKLPKESVRERIQRRAYELWETEGRPEGREHAHWHQAELEITRARSQRAGAGR